MRSLPARRSIASRERLTLAAVLATAAIEVALAAIVLLLAHPAPLDSLTRASAMSRMQFAGGAAIGVGLAALQVGLLFALPRWRTFSQSAVGALRLSLRDIALICVAVGVAEELLFRAALQPLVGNVWTSLAFTAAHANYVPGPHTRSTWGWSFIALAMVFALSLLLGETFERVGLVAAVVAHASYDFVVLLAYQRMFGKRN